MILFQRPLLLIFCLVGFIPIHADPLESPKLFLELPIIDLPYQIDAAKTVKFGNVDVGSFLQGYENPGMHLSLSITADLYSCLHYSIGKLFDADNLFQYGSGKRILFTLTLGATDFVSFWVPGFMGWEHEEYHRAVMSRFHVSSFNESNRFPIFKMISVDHVLDEDLIKFKQKSPTDFIRMQVAGIEGEYELVERLRRNQFFYKQKFYNTGLYFVAIINSIAYVKKSSIASYADKMTNNANTSEKTIAKRDFTGLDFLGWTHDLFRPDEPYADRGIHPSGIGIDRYIKTTDLSNEEFSYLKKQGNLQFLNLISPVLIPSSLFDVNFDKIHLTKNGLYGTLALHHYLTSFGNDIFCTVFLLDMYNKFIFGLHCYQNYRHSFPAVEAQMIDWEKSFLSQTILISPHLLLGMQPLDQSFRTSKAAFAGLFECKFELSTRAAFRPFAELSAKSKGWIAGNEFLDRNLSFRCGVIGVLK